MKLAELTWQDVSGLSRDTLVVIPTGSCEQHGPHLPLFTDSLLATAVAEAVEARLHEKVLLTPTLWLGASSHHLEFSGTLSATMLGYGEALKSVIESLHRHGFWRFFVLNGHGGNNSPNDVALRELKEKYPNLLLGARGYYQYILEESAQVMEGPVKTIMHACEAEASLILHLRPELVRKDKLRDDGLTGSTEGMVNFFHEVTEEGSLGYATLASAEKGKRLFEAAVEAVSRELDKLADGFSLEGLPPK